MAGTTPTIVEEQLKLEVLLSEERELNQLNRDVFAFHGKWNVAAWTINGLVATWLLSAPTGRFAPHMCLSFVFVNTAVFLACVFSAYMFGRDGRRAEVVAAKIDSLYPEFAKRNVQPHRLSIIMWSHAVVGALLIAGWLVLLAQILPEAKTPPRTAGVMTPAGNQNRPQVATS